jgi:predicted HTH domain antitoxin
VEEDLSRAVGEWKKEHYARQYEEGRLGLSKAAQDAGISLWEMMDYVRRRKISAQYDLDDLKEDIETVRRRVAGQRSGKLGRN